MVIERYVTRASTQLPVGTIVFDEFEIDTLLGTGISGAVYRCRTRDPRRPFVALKLFRSDIAGDKTAAVRLSREMRALFRVEHPNVTRYFDSFRSSEYVGLALEYVEGVNLDRIIAETTEIDIIERLNWLLQIAAGIQAIHSVGIVHRDLKPANIIVGANDELKITDFGLALLNQEGAASGVRKRLLEMAESAPGSARVTASGAAVGTPAYVAPEYLIDDVLDHRSDVYSLGMIGYELIAGKYPFEYEKVLDLLELKIAEDPPHPQIFNNACSEELGDVLLRALERNPGDRYQRIEAFMADLRLMLQQYSVQRSRERNVAWGNQVPATMFNVDRDIFDEQTLYRPTNLLREALQPRSVFGDFFDFIGSLFRGVSQLLSYACSGKGVLAFLLVVLQMLAVVWYFRLI